MSSRPVRALITLLAAAAAGSWACSDSGDNGPPPPPEPRATTITLVSGGGQTATVDQTLPSAVVVRVDDQNGDPMAGQSISFAVTAGGGSIDPASATTDNGGQASTSWTLGTVAGAQQIRATVTGVTGLEALVNATANPDVAHAAEIVHGNDQIGIISELLFDSLVVQVSDQFGNGVAGHSVTFTATAGSGSVSPTDATTDADGKAFTRWTLGSTIGNQAVDVDAGGLQNEPLSFTAEGTNLTITSITPDPLVELQAATITGTGFSTTPANNTVLVEGVAGTVTASTSTSITFTVPDFDCKPARDVSVQVQVGGSNSMPETRALDPAGTVVTVGVGEQQVVRAPDDLCLQFAETTENQQYLIGVQSTSETVTNVTPITLAGAKDPAAPAPPAVAPAQAALPLGGVDLLDSPRAQRWLQHRLAEIELRDMERRLLPRPPAGFAAAAAAGYGPTRVPPDVEEGDVVPIKFPDVESLDFCNEFINITTVVKKKGTRGIWLEDQDNPVSGFTDTDYQSLSDQLDSPIYTKDVEYFGDPSDLDANDRIVVVVTKRVNEREGVLGFVVSSDLVSTVVCPSSNEAEVYYARAPDEGGTACTGCPDYPRSTAIVDAPFLIAHEFAHIIQFSSRIQAGAATFQSRWELEGQATLAEEVVGFAFEGKAPGNDYGISVILNTDDDSDVDWYSNAIADLGLYFGWDPHTGPDAKIGTAPHECSWLARDDEGNDGPCTPIRQVYGTPWTLLRWMSDHFGPGMGGDAAVQRALVAEDGAGYASVENVLGVQIEDVLAQWAAMLWADNRVPGLTTRLTLPSWDLFDIFYGVDPISSQFIRPALRLAPKAATFTDFSASANVRAASTYYTLISSVGRPTFAVKARGDTGGDLPSHMQVWIVRTQ